MGKLHVVLIEPQIPQNTGNIARTCAATATVLHLIKPLGFVIDDKKLKRAGLDYWHLLDIRYYENLDEFFEKNDGQCYFLTTKADKIYSDVNYINDQDTYLLFGREDAGISERVLQDNIDKTIRLPMIGGARSLNLSNTVAIAVYEVLRQWEFCNLKRQADYFKIGGH